MSFKLRNKVVQHNGKHYFVTLVRLSRVMPDHFVCLLVSDEDTFEKAYTRDEYNNLPYYWFEMGEQAPKPAGVWDDYGNLVYDEPNYPKNTLLI